MNVIQRKTSFRADDPPPPTMNEPLPPDAASPSGQPLLSPMQNGARRTSGNHLTTPSRFDTPQPNSSPANSENSAATWSSAIGHATTSGKSGRVIERLMTENDKLKRDLNAQIIKCQELEKSMQTYKPQIEALRAENDNLSHARDVDASLISRRDRKIEEMRADLYTERMRRDQAEATSRQREREKEDVEEQTKRDVQNLSESTKHATVHAEILETSHRQLGAEYRARAEAWKKDLAGLAEGRDQDRQKLARLDVVTEQMRQELERLRRVNGEIGEAWEGLKEESERRLQSIEEDNLLEGEKARELNAEMDRVVGKMRWVMRVKETVGEASEG